MIILLNGTLILRALTVSLTRWMKYFMIWKMSKIYTTLESPVGLRRDLLNSSIGVLEVLEEFERINVEYEGYTIKEKEVDNLERELSVLREKLKDVSA